MLTAIAVLLLSAVGGGVVGAYLTNSYPHDAICYECKEKAQYQEEVKYDSFISESDNSENFQQQSFNKVEDVNQNNFQDEY